MRFRTDGLVELALIMHDCGPHDQHCACRTSLPDIDAGAAGSIQDLMAVLEKAALQFKQVMGSQPARTPPALALPGKQTSHQLIQQLSLLTALIGDKFDCEKQLPHCNAL